MLKEVDHRNVRMLFDTYHMQIQTGNVTAFIKENIRYIGHFHIAGVPGRHEPADNELNYKFILYTKLIDLPISLNPSEEYR
ncbi:MAG: TIM barrel protein [Spirochaetes bacterium]|nr:TIM barrel protein [Spirochaetota bacterium]